jgi:hypothetical protein
MNAKPLIWIIALFLLVAPAQSVVLLFNQTFSSVNIGNFTLGGSTWAITSSGCKTGSCLSYTGGAAGYAYVANSTFNINYSNYPNGISLRFWVNDPGASGDASYPSVMYLFNDSNNYWALGHTINTNTQDGFANISNIAGAYAIARTNETVMGNMGFVWMEINLTPSGGKVWASITKSLPNATGLYRQYTNGDQA